MCLPMRFPAAVAAEQSWRGWSRRLSRRGQPFTKGDLSGASGPQPHCDFIEVCGEAAFGGGQGAVAGVGEDGAIVSGSGGRSTGTASGVAGTLLTRSHAFQARSFIRLRSRLSSARHSCGGGHPLGHLSTLESTTDSVQPSDQSSNCVRLRMCRDHLRAFPVSPPSVNRR
jgi:hypothetical protein